MNMTKLAIIHNHHKGLARRGTSRQLLLWRNYYVKVGNRAGRILADVFNNELARRNANNLCIDCGSKTIAQWSDDVYEETGDGYWYPRYCRRHDKGTVYNSTRM